MKDYENVWMLPSLLPNQFIVSMKCMHKSSPCVRGGTFNPKWLTLFIKVVVLYEQLAIHPCKSLLPVSTKRFRNTMPTEQPGRKIVQHEASPVYATKAYRGIRRTFPLIINLGFMEAHCRHNAPSGLPPVKKPQYVLNRRLGEPHVRYGRFGVQKISWSCWDSIPRTSSP
jgi:hypothetical protein